jgi:CRISPR/Cas system-associated exonuclease Cas4 (RecB family)
MGNRFKKQDDKQQREENAWAYEGDLDLSVSPEQMVEGLPYISKSRVKMWLKCPRSFAFKYWAGVREPANFYMVRGGEVHEAFELFHRNVTEYVREHGERPEWYTDFMGPSDNWMQHMTFLGPFWEWEDARWEACDGDLDLWLPHSVEEELWVEDPPIGDLPWMGPYDALYHAASIPWVEDNSGLVVVDYKTGSYENAEKYDRKGINIDLEFYCWMLDELDYDIRAGIGMFPKGDTYEVVVRDYPNPSAQKLIEKAVRSMNDNLPTSKNYPTKTGPLCGWCYFEDQCPARA